MNYAALVHVFIELRERGGSLSPADLQTLAKWEKSGIDAQAAAHKMHAFKRICEKQGEEFPNSLRLLESRLKKWAESDPDAFRSF